MLSRLWPPIGRPALSDQFAAVAVTITHATGKLSGQDTGGSSAYQGDTGTITGRTLRNGAILTVTYHH